MKLKLDDELADTIMAKVLKDARRILKRDSDDLLAQGDALASYQKVDLADNQAMIFHITDVLRYFDK